MHVYACDAAYAGDFVVRAVALLLRDAARSDLVCGDVAARLMLVQMRY